jgi:hypothetical protein
MENGKKRNFDYLPLSIRLETLGQIATPLVLRGTPLPATRSDSFTTAADQQTSVEIKILMGESSLSRNNLVLGTFHMKEIPKAKRGEAQITVEFSLDKTCAVTARATVKGTQLTAEEKFHAPDLSDEFLKKVLAEAEASRESDELELARREVKGRAQTLLGEAEELLRSGPNQRLSEAVAALGLAMSTDNDHEMKKRTLELDSILHVPDFSDLFSDMFNAQKTRPLSKPAPVVSRVKRSPAKAQENLVPSAPQHPLGKIFGGGSFTLEPQLCFVLMPFDAKFQPVYEDHIRPTIERAGLRCERADEIRGVKQITSDIWERINRCRFLVAELTDQNANVFYELGLAHALGKDVIPITQSMTFVPFDIKTLRCVVYDTTARGTKKLESDLAATIDSVIKSS